MQTKTSAKEKTVEKTVIDKTNELWKWLDANATVVARPEDMANGTGKETIFTCPAEKEDDFVKAYYRAFDTREAMLDCECPKKDEVWKIVTANDELPHDGPYSWQKRGYDFDGFYESGSSGKVECLRYYSFREARAFWWTAWPMKGDRLYVDVDHYADGNPCMLYVVCFVKDENKEQERK